MPSRSAPPRPAGATRPVRGAAARLAPEDAALTGALSSVDRAVDVLLLFGRSLQPSLGVTEISQELGLPKSGVHRVLTTLRRRRLLTYDPHTRKYALGQAAIALSQSYITRLDLESMASESLTALRQATDETATLAVRRHGSVTYRAQSVPERELRYEARIGRPSPLHAGASGKAFLAFLPEDESEDYLRRAAVRGVLPALTARTCSDPDALRTELAWIRERGVATSAGERVDGVSAVAAPVLDYEDYPVAVLAVAGPTARFDVTGPDVEGGAAADAVRDAARTLSIGMGRAL